MNAREDVLSAAKACVTGDRADTYGDVEDCFDVIAHVVGVSRHRDISERDYKKAHELAKIAFAKSYEASLVIRDLLETSRAIDDVFLHKFANDAGETVVRLKDEIAMTVWYAEDRL